MPSFLQIGATIGDLWSYKDTKFFMKSANFIMLYTGNFVLRYLCLVFAN